MIVWLNENRLPNIYAVINDAPRRYAGHIPPEAHQGPYAPWEEIQEEAERMDLFGWEEAGDLLGVMGHQRVRNVTLIRHAYVRTAALCRGLGSRPLAHLVERTDTPRILLGTWAGATWAVAFDQTRDFQLLAEKDSPLESYWHVSNQQREHSVVLGRNLT